MSTGKSNRLVTQMYFAGEPLNDKDPFLQGTARQGALDRSPGPPTQGFEPDSRVAVVGHRPGYQGKVAASGEVRPGQAQAPPYLLILPLPMNRQTL